MKCFPSVPERKKYQMNNIGLYYLNLMLIQAILWEFDVSSKFGPCDIYRGYSMVWCWMWNSFHSWEFFLNIFIGASHSWKYQNSCLNCEINSMLNVFCFLYFIWFLNISFKFLTLHAINKVMSRSLVTVIISNLLFSQCEKNSL